MKFEELLRREYGEQIAAPLLESLEKDRTHCLILNKEKIDTDAFLKQHPHVVAHPFIPGAFSFSSAEAFGKSFAYDVGAFSIQDASAMMVPFLLNPKPGETLLDFCAAPGGKSVFASLMMENRGTILANDISYPRAKTLSSAVERMGRRNVVVSASDFSSCYRHYEQAFDKIILDAPCSGTAMFRKNEQARREWSEAKAEKFSAIQRDLLEMAATMLKDGGTMVYSTCSFLREENEDVVLSFLSAHKEFSPLPVGIDDPSFYHSPLLPEGIHFLPHLFPGEGQYLILLRKAGERKGKTEPPFRKDQELDAFCASLGLESAPYLSTGAGVYRLPSSASFPKLNLLRPGLKILSSRDPFVPDFALARASDARLALPLSEAQAKAYLRGETFPCEEKDGWRVLAYGPYALGWAKIVRGVAKNHYPKGLRHAYADLYEK